MNNSRSNSSSNSSISTTTSSIINSNNLWINKYNPNTTLEDLISSPLIKKAILNLNSSSSNIILTGPCGTGKTASMLLIAKQLLKDDFYKSGDSCCYIQINPADDGGNKFSPIHEILTNFCKNKNHKLIMLDELDNMSKKVQQLVSTLIDTNSTISGDSKLIFIMTCNNSSDILESIQSRSTIVRFSKLDETLVVERLRYISNIEKLKYNEQSLKDIYTTCNGDLRIAINNLQLISIGFDEINSENVYSMCDKPNPLVIKNIIMSCIKKDIKASLIILGGLREKGYSNSDIVLNMIYTLKGDTIILEKDILEETRIKYMDIINKSCLNIMKGIDTDIQLTGCIAAMCRR